MIPHLHPHAGDCEHACCLKIEHLSVHIGGETILDNIDLHMHCGQMVALIGPNGAGKSTLIRAILGQREYEGKSPSMRPPARRQSCASAMCRRARPLTAVTP